MTARLSTGRHDARVRSPSETPAGISYFDMDLVQGTGQWQNMQEVVRSTIKALLDTQAEHQQRIAAQEKQILDVQALLLGSRKLKLSPYKDDSFRACREEAARATAAAAETAASLSRLRDDVSAARGDAKAEADDLLTRLESKASKEHVKACLDAKPSLGEVAELRGRVDRLAKGEGSSFVETREVEGLREQSQALGNRLAEVETRVRGCEALAVRVDPAAVALRIETVSSRLAELSRRVDHKASAKAAERALDRKADKSPLRTALDSKADRAHLSAIEASVSSLLDSSRERAAAATSLERKVAAAAAVADTATSSAAAAASLGRRADGQDKALARLSAEVAAATAAAAASASSAAAAAERTKGGGRCGCERELRRAGRRLERVEGGLSAVATASAGAAERANKTADVLEERCRKRTEDEVGAIADAVEALAERVQGWEPSRQLEAVRQLVDSRVEVSATESTARAAAALAERLSTFESGVQEILSEFSRGLASQGAGAAKEPRSRDNEAAGSTVPQASGGSGADARISTPVALERDPERRERNRGEGTERRGRPGGRREAETGGPRSGGVGAGADPGAGCGCGCAAALPGTDDETRPRRSGSTPTTGAGVGREEAGTCSTVQRAGGAVAPRPVGAAAVVGAGEKPKCSSSSSSASASSCFPLRSPGPFSPNLPPAVPPLMGTAAAAAVAERAAGGARSVLAAGLPESMGGRHALRGGSYGSRPTERGGRCVTMLTARSPEAAAATAATAALGPPPDCRPRDDRRQETLRPRSAAVVGEKAMKEEEEEEEEWTQAGGWAMAGGLPGQIGRPGSSSGTSGRTGPSARGAPSDGGIANRIEELRREKEAYREIASRALYA